MRSSAQFLEPDVSGIGLRKGFGDQLWSALTQAGRRVFKSSRQHTIIVGSNPAMRLIAAELFASGHSVTLVELHSKPAAESSAPPFVTVVDEATDDEALLARAAAKGARCLIAAVDDERNLNLCRTAIKSFGVPVTIARLRLFEGNSSWARVTSTGLARMDWPTVVKTALGDLAPSHMLTRMLSVGIWDRVVDLELRSPALAGRKVGELGDECEIVAISRGRQVMVAGGEIALELGDLVTLFGPPAAVERMREEFTSL